MLLITGGVAHLESELSAKALHLLFDFLLHLGVF
jgi:hypothetical protein